MNSISGVTGQSGLVLGAITGQATEKASAKDCLDAPFDLTMSPEDMVEALGRLIQKVAGQQRELAKTEKLAARRERIACEENEVEEMREKASSIRDGAIVSSVCSIGSGALGIASAVDVKDAQAGLGNEALKEQNTKIANAGLSDSSSVGMDWKTAFSSSSRSLSDLSQPLGKWVGDAPAAMHDANAKAAEFASKRAEDKASDASDMFQEYQALAQEAQDTMKACQRRHDDTIDAILRRM